MSRSNFRSHNASTNIANTKNHTPTVSIVVVLTGAVLRVDADPFLKSPTHHCQARLSQGRIFLKAKALRIKIIHQSKLPATLSHNQTNEDIAHTSAKSATYYHTALREVYNPASSPLFRSLTKNRGRGSHRLVQTGRVPDRLDREDS